MGARLAERERELRAAREAVASAATTQQAASVRSPAFDTGRNQAEAHIAAGKFEAALAVIDSLKLLDGAEYTRANLETKRDEVARG